MRLSDRVRHLERLLGHRWIGSTVLCAASALAITCSSSEIELAAASEQHLHRGDLLHEREQRGHGQRRFDNRQHRRDGQHRRNG